MEKGLRKYVGLFLVVVYAFFYASTNMFYHTHQFSDGRVVHSHPFGEKGHNHTAGQILLFSVVEEGAYNGAETIHSPEFIPVDSIEVSSDERADAAQSVHCRFFSLRAPPVLGA